MRGAPPVGDGLAMSAPLGRDPTGLWMREGSMDDLIIRERTLYLRLEPKPEDVVLDLGANIGAVSAAFLEAGVRKLVALEPEPQNFELLKRNLSQFGERAILLNVAAASTSGVRELWISGTRNFGLHSLVHRRGRRSISVPCVALEGLMALTQPTLLKIDIEGGEYELAPVLRALPTAVRGLAMELHLGRQEWRTRLAPELIAALGMQGFREQGRLRIAASNPGTVGVWLR